MIGYEIHTYKDGRWRIDSIFDNEELAVFEARRVIDSKRYAGVLVIEEIYDEAVNRATWRTVFRGGTFANRLWGNLYALHRKASRAETKSRQRKERLPTVGEQPHAPTSRGFLAPVIALIVIAFGGVAAMLGLRHLFGL